VVVGKLTNKSEKETAVWVGKEQEHPQKLPFPLSWGHPWGLRHPGSNLAPCALGQ